MALWLVRAGRSGEFETKYLEEKKIYVTWDELDYDLTKFDKQRELDDFLRKKYPDIKMCAARNWAAQIWRVAKVMKKGDWVVVPSKLKPAIHIGEVIGDYIFHPKNKPPFFHSRDVRWIETDIPRINFDQDLLYSFGAFMTICEIKRNNAENRVRVMQKNGWKAAIITKIHKLSELEGIDESGDIDVKESTDLGELARDEISKHIIAKFKGHGMAKLIEAILKAQGYSTYISQEGPDNGVDILASPGSLGFGRPRICVQVKTGDNPVDRPTLDQLLGAMQNFNADQGLLVSWGGFKSSVDKEIPKQFFRVRLWDQSSIIKELTDVYDKLDEDIRAEIPLKKIWTLTIGAEENK